MSETVIKIENLSKSYLISHEHQERYSALRDVIAEKTNRFFSMIKDGVSGRPTENVKQKKEKFWALKDVFLEVQKGEVIGVIGRNGAGKSTLLKILTRITEPSEGIIKVKGRVASLLEVGTGFHPELTGRENIYLSGAILGMKRQEIKRCFDDIVHFSGVEKFLDTPVKRYSSGMFVRLGFAIAAHLEAEILLIDEVLAVGDLEFQKKCLGKMNEVAKGGRTVLFVSHNLGAIQQLCGRAVLLEKGEIYFAGDVQSTIAAYIDMNIPAKKDEGFKFKDKCIQSIRLFNGKNKRTTKFSPNSEMIISVAFSSAHKLKLPVLGIVIKDEMNTPIIGVNNRHYGESFLDFFSEKGIFTIKIKGLPFISGNYYIDLYLGDVKGDFELIENAADFFISNDTGVAHSSNLNRELNKLFIEDVEWGIQDVE